MCAINLSGGNTADPVARSGAPRSRDGHFLAEAPRLDPGELQRAVQRPVRDPGGGDPHLEGAGVPGWDT